MGNTENGSRQEGHGGISPLKTFLGTLGAFSVLSAGCAEAADSKTPKPVKIASAERVVETTGDTCGQIQDLLKKIQCENAALDKGLEADASEIATLNTTEIKIDDENADIDQAIDLGKTKNDVLMKELEDSILGQAPTR